jgi:ribosomal protein L14
MLRVARRLLQAQPAAQTAAATPAANPAAQPAEARSWYRTSMIVKRMGSYASYWGTGMEHPHSGVALNDHALLHCVDNTNCKHIRILKQGNERMMHSRVLPCVVHRVSLVRFASGQEALARQKLRPGTLYWCVLFSRRQANCRYSGLVSQFDRNTGVLINDKRVPVGSRVMYCAARHVNHKVHLKAAVLANFFI